MAETSAVTAFGPAVELPERKAVLAVPPPTTGRSVADTWRGDRRLDRLILPLGVSTLSMDPLAEPMRSYSPSIPIALASVIGALFPTTPYASIVVSCAAAVACAATKKLPTPALAFSTGVVRTWLPSGSVTRVYLET